jgi:AraC family transcriptional regulator
MPIHSRKEWAFQFIVSGECSLCVREGGKVREQRLRAPVLVACGSEAMYAYRGKPQDVCNIIVFHFDEAYFQLRHLLGRTGWRVAPVRAVDVRQAVLWYQRCQTAKKKNDVLAPLVYNIVALELTLLLFQLLPQQEFGVAADFTTSKVAEAQAWYQANLARGLSIQEVADAVHVSVTHLRRLFHKVRKMSPQEAFTQMQFDRVKELMLDGVSTLEQIADAAGFESGSAFSRAFKKEFEVSPKVYRAMMRSDISSSKVKAAFLSPTR